MPTERLKGFGRGVGIGGWLTNYKRFNVLPEEWRQGLTVGDFEHFDAYISEADVERIASWGMDHIRLGFDQIVLEEAPFRYRERIFALMDRFVAWCGKRRMSVVLNLHKAVGNYCDIREPVALLDDQALQDRFVALWETMERRWHAQDGLAFELLNEVRDVPAERWNELAARTVAALRRLNPRRSIVVGGTCWNSAAALDRLRLFEDENVFYTFHFYAPFEFTHQRGVLQAGPLYYNREMRYPDGMDRYRDYRRTVGQPVGDYAACGRMDREYLRREMEPAFAFRRRHPGKTLWCGEFGTIRHCPLAYRENWMRDVIALLKEHGIPYCAWNYLSTPNDGNRFSLVDDDRREILSPRLLDILRGFVE